MRGKETGVAAKIKPLGDRVVVKRLEAETTTKGGIVLPDTAKEKPREGRVVAVGGGAQSKSKRVPLELKKGDRVLMASYGGTEVTIGDEELVILKEEDVLAILEA